MASTVSIAIRRTEALDRARTALDAIAECTGVVVDDYPPVPKRQEMQGAIEAEWLAAALEAIATAVAPDALDLDGMKRADLDAHAATLGIEDAEGYPNKAALIAAIKERAGTVSDPKNPQANDGGTATTTTTPAPMPAPETTDQSFPAGDAPEDEGE